MISKLTTQHVAEESGGLPHTSKVIGECNREYRTSLESLIVVVGWILREDNSWLDENGIGEL